MLPKSVHKNRIEENLQSTPILVYRCKKLVLTAHQLHTFQSRCSKSSKRRRLRTSPSVSSTRPNRGDSTLTSLKTRYEKNSTCCRYKSKVEYKPNITLSQAPSSCGCKRLMEVQCPSPHILPGCRQSSTFPSIILVNVTYSTQVFFFHQTSDDCLEPSDIRSGGHGNACYLRWQSTIQLDTNKLKLYRQPIFNVGAF